MTEAEARRVTEGRRLVDDDGNEPQPPTDPSVDSSDDET